jgi:carboxyl-terminal processing protease
MHLNFTFHHLTLAVLVPLLSFQVGIAQTETKQAPLQVSSYLDTVFSILHENALHRRSIAWDSIRTVLFREAAQAESTSDCYPAIRRVLPLLQDFHSYLMTPSQRAKWDTAHYSAQKHPESRFLKGKVGLVTIPPFASRDTIEQKLYASDVRNHLDRLRGSGANRWIIDLRSNLGGNMWPMLAGLSSLLSADTVGYFVNPDGRKDAWRSHAETMSIAQEVEPIAVLIGPSTCSSGEAIAIAFKCRPRTRFFGLPSCGLTTDNDDFPLPDGALLMLTINIFADRCGVPYPAGVKPDEQVGNLNRSDSTAVVTACQWLLKENVH